MNSIFAVTKQSPNRSAWLLGLGLVTALLLFSGQTFAMEQPCRAHFQRKAFIASAQCYLRLFQQVDANKGLQQVQKLLKDRYLEQAAIAWNQAANTSPKPALRGWYKERAISQLQRSLRAKYCQASSRCVRHMALIAKLRQEVGYVPVTIVTGDSDTQISIVGLHYNKTERQRFQESLRPGNYTITLTTKGKPKRTQVIEVRSGRKLVINVTPVKIQVVEKQVIVARRIPPLVLVGYIAGGAMIIGGAVMLVYGIAQQGELNAIRQDPARNPNQSDAAFNESFDQAQLISGVGALVAGTGGLLFAAGVIAHVLSPKGKQPPPQATGNTQLGSFGWQATSHGAQ